ncbi:MAG: hypothetical protein KatS3mg102_2993 [Planctomycetota bacterium]|nr:MAG: hypothetical protein KatS3mg102_2993 [Planctomycetota bacterium]
MSFRTFQRCLLTVAAIFAFGALAPLAHRTLVGAEAPAASKSTEVVEPLPAEQPAALPRLT